MHWLEHSNSVTISYEGGNGKCSLVSAYECVGETKKTVNVIAKSKWNATGNGNIQWCMHLMRAAAAKPKLRYKYLHMLI